MSKWTDDQTNAAYKGLDKKVRMAEVEKTPLQMGIGFTLMTVVYEKYQKLGTTLKEQGLSDLDCEFVQKTYISHVVQSVYEGLKEADNETKARD